jgi:hypothetical protein
MIKLCLCLCRSVPSGWAKHAIWLQFAVAPISTATSHRNGQCHRHLLRYQYHAHAGTMANGRGGYRLGDKAGRKDANMLYCEPQCVVPLWAAALWWGQVMAHCVDMVAWACQVLAAAQCSLVPPRHTELDSTTPCLAYLRQNLLRKQKILVLGNNTTWDPQMVVNDMIFRGGKLTWCFNAICVWAQGFPSQKYCRSIRLDLVATVVVPVSVRREGGINNRCSLKYAASW